MVPIPHSLGYVFSSTTPPIEVTIDLPRGVDSTQATASLIDRVISTELVVTEYVQAYEPITDCCVDTCP